MEPQVCCGGLKTLTEQILQNKVFQGAQTLALNDLLLRPSHLRVPSGKLFKGRFLQPSSKNFDSEGLEKRPGNLHCKSAHSGCDAGSLEADFEKQT